MDYQKGRIVAILGIACKNTRLLAEKSERSQRLFRNFFIKNFVRIKGKFYNIFVGYTGRCPLINNIIVIGSTINGNFSDGHYVHIDATSPEKLTITTDPAGLVNLYVYHDNSITIFGTSSLHVAALLDDYELDPLGMIEFLTAGYLITNRTFFKNITVLPGGREWQLSIDGTREINDKKSIQFSSHYLDLKRAINYLTDSLSNVATELLYGHRRPLCDLTGGFDSRGILASFLNANSNRFSTVVNGSESSPDVIAAGNIAKKFNLKHHFNNKERFALPSSYSDIRKILLLTDGEIEFSEYYSTYMVHCLTNASGYVSVNGSGGELFRGYWWEGYYPFETRIGNPNLEYIQKRIFAPFHKWDIFEPEIVKLTKENIDKWLRDILLECPEESPLGNKVDYIYLKIRIGRWLARYYSSTIKILPCFSPFLIDKVLRLAFQIDPDLKKRNKFYRLWLKDINYDLAALPLSNGLPALPITFRTLLKFWRAPLYYAEKIKNKICATNINFREHNQPIDPLTAFVKIIDSEFGFEDFFSSSLMLTASIYNSKFIALLQQGKPDNFYTLPVPLTQLAKMLTLELTIIELEKIKKEILL